MGGIVKGGRHGSAYALRRTRALSGRSLPSSRQRGSTSAISPPSFWLAPLAPDIIKRYRGTARGDWALEAQTLTDQAWQIGAAVNEGADPAMAQSVAAAIDRVTPADVQRLAKVYLQHYTVALVMPRRGP